ncbi:TlpA disulfide reductase family protein [uncultured Chitinophaga sp.]|uniref:TlpA disulfide reductase family protein n=1 Tax=uncultured Chitinophaga sp. TaxID=339340 RepID=UPI002630891B|nr:TlpA disulfide reductase family protein [uncultured Chitinophaga sp.]
MQKTILSVIAIAAALQVSAQQKYTVDLYLAGQEGHKLTLSYVTKGQRHSDTAEHLPDGGFRFSGEIAEPVVAVVFNSHPGTKFQMSQGGMFIPGPLLEFVLEDGRTTIKGTSEKSYMALAKGGKLNTEFAKLHARELPLIEKKWELTKEGAIAFRNGDTARSKACRQEASALDGKKNELRKAYIANHPGSFVSMYLLAILYEEYTPQAYAEAYGKLASSWKPSFYGQLIASKIESTRATALGMQAIDFTKKDIQGNDFTLSSLKGKYVLVDFWGSWCGPCRASHPHMRKLYEHYKPKGLEIVGISEEKTEKIADAEKFWKGAVEKDGINWLHVMNNYGKADFDLVQKYGITGFPTKFLLDPQGKIVWKLVGGGKESEDQLDAKLKELLGQ